MPSVIVSSSPRFGLTRYSVVNHRAGDAQLDLDYTLLRVSGFRKTKIVLLRVPFIHVCLSDFCVYNGQVDRMSAMSSSAPSLLHFLITELPRCQSTQTSPSPPRVTSNSKCPSRTRVASLIRFSALPETQTLDDSNVENEKAQIIEGHEVPGKAVGSKLFPAGKYFLCFSVQPTTGSNYV